MNKINFKSTHKIPINQNGINNTKKIQLKSLISTYKTGTFDQLQDVASVSIPDELDKSFLRKLKKIGYKFYQIISNENITKENINKTIKKEEKSIIETPFEELFKNRENNVEKLNKIRNSKDYKRIQKKYGTDAAEAMFFFSREK